MLNLCQKTGPITLSAVNVGFTLQWSRMKNQFVAEKLVLFQTLEGSTLFSNLMLQVEKMEH